MKRFLVAKQSFLLAGGLVFVLTLWMLTGHGSRQQAASPQPRVARAEQPMRVQVQEYVSQPVHREIVLNGKTEPQRAVTVRAEVDGRVVAVESSKGEQLESGQIIARVDQRNRPARLQEARALVKQRELEYAASERLLTQNHVSETQLAQARASLEAARAMRRLIEVELDNTLIRAPFDGFLQERTVEIGDYVSRGDAVARILDEDPILITGDVSQTDLHEVVAGMSAQARLVTGQNVQGRVTYVARESDPATRTFHVEVEVPNSDGALVSGLTSEITIPTPAQDAHFLSPAHLSLGDRGEIGVKTVGEGDAVEFHKVAIVRADTEGLWVTGLPDVIRVVTVGHGFVSDGQRVTPVYAGQLSRAQSRGDDNSEP